MIFQKVFVIIFQLWKRIFLQLRKVNLIFIIITFETNSFEDIIVEKVSNV